MISIIICSRKPDISAELRNNIDTTIGCDHEIVVIDNSRNQYSIFSAYNEGVRRAKGEILCFCHDDLMFRSKDWGGKVKNIFVDETIGMVGVAGTHFLPKCPMYWWSSPFISQFNLENDHGTLKKNETVDYFHGDLSDVVAVDGLCFFITQALFKSIRFDDVTYKGFHAYDMDISLQVQSLGKRVCVTRSILVEHFWSESSFANKRYMGILDDNLLLLFNKWENYLPLVRGIVEPDIVITRINYLFIQAYDAKKARRSKAYRLGSLLLMPLRILKKAK